MTTSDYRRRLRAGCSANSTAIGTQADAKRVPDSIDAAAAVPKVLAQLALRAGDMLLPERLALLHILERIERRTRPRVAALAWSLNPTGGNAERWAEVWAALLPQWKRRAPAIGVTHRETYRSDEFRGTRAALIGLGLACDGDFPRDSGRGRSMVTFAEDGDPKRKGESGPRRAAVRILRSGEVRYTVEVYPPEEEVERRREQQLRDAPFGQVLQPATMPARAQLRLVHSAEWYR